MAKARNLDILHPLMTSRLFSRLMSVLLSANVGRVDGQTASIGYTVRRRRIPAIPNPGENQYQPLLFMQKHIFERTVDLIGKCQANVEAECSPVGIVSVELCSKSSEMLTIVD